MRTKKKFKKFGAKILQASECSSNDLKVSLTTGRNIQKVHRMRYCMIQLLAIFGFFSTEPLKWNLFSHLKCIFGAYNFFFDHLG